MQFFVAGATAVQIGTANFCDPTVTMKILDQLPETLRSAGVGSVAELVGTLVIGP
jgi:dihydroorotate dehydrogenase (NAD+) catalytic subunit